MKYFQFSLILTCAVLFSCRQGSQPSEGASSNANDPLVERFSTEIPPDSQRKMEQIAKIEVNDYKIFHNTPPLEDGPNGFYSYLGMAREFENICGFAIPEWVKCVEGEYYSSLRGGKPVSWTVVEYKIDPDRATELAKLISESNSNRWPENGSMGNVFNQLDSRTPKYMIGNYFVQLDSINFSEIAISIFDDGRLRLRHTRGPKDWDK